jgi:hypothetical protein
MDQSGRMVDGQSQGKVSCSTPLVLGGGGGAGTVIGQIGGGCSETPQADNPTATRQPEVHIDGCGSSPCDWDAISPSVAHF